MGPNSKLSLHRINPLLHQLLRRISKTAKPLLEQTLQLGVRAVVTTSLLPGLLSLPNNPMVTPVDTPVVLPTSPSCSKQSPPVSSTFPQSPPGPPSPSSASWPSSASSPASPASSSSRPSTWCWPPLSSASPCPLCWPATSSTPSSPSSTPSAPSSSSCPACTGCTCAASLWPTPQTGAFASPTLLGTKTTTTTVIEFILECIEPQKYCVYVMKYIYMEQCKSQ